MSVRAAAETRRAFCSAVSHLSGEPLAATASRVDHWILVEYRGAWTSNPLAGSILSPEVKQHLRAQVASLSHAKLLLVKKRERAADNGACVFFAASKPGHERLHRLEVAHPDELVGVDLASAGEPVEGPLYLVCTHGKRDRCCALYGRPLYDALRAATDTGRVWQSTHVGGDRFAGNVVVLPHGLYYGRVDPGGVERLLELTAGGRLDLEHYRGRSSCSFPVQAAERALREAEGLGGIDDVTVVHTTRVEPGRWRVRLQTPDARVHELAVAESLAEEPSYLTCESAEPERARRWDVTLSP